MRYSPASTGKRKGIKYLVIVLLVIYILLLSKYLLFARLHTDPEAILSLKHIRSSFSRGMHEANLRPFSMIKLMYRGKNMSPEFQYTNLVGNVLGFVPLGIFLPLLFRRFSSLFSVAALVFVVSLAFELIQLCTGLGIFDVDDLILNTTGGIIGFAVHFCAAIIYRQPLTKTSGEV